LLEGGALARGLPAIPLAHGSLLSAGRQYMCSVGSLPSSDVEDDAARLALQTHTPATIGVISARRWSPERFEQRPVATTDPDAEAPPVRRAFRVHADELLTWPQVGEERVERAAIDDDGVTPRSHPSVRAHAAAVVRETTCHVG